MSQLGESAGVKFDFNAYIDRQPIESQRLLLWSGRFGKQEAFMSALSNRHFQHGSQGESASKRATLLAAAEEVGLDVAAATAFLDSNELHAEVWRSYGEMPARGINAIPMFCFSIPEVNLWSGPFRTPKNGRVANAVIQGSANKAEFLDMFKQLYKFAASKLGEALKRTSALPQPDACAAPPEEADVDMREFIGQRVRIGGLKARPELNGAVGVCESYDAKAGRCGVRLPSQPKPLAVRLANFERVVMSGNDDSAANGLDADGLEKEREVEVIG